MSPPRAVRARQSRVGREQHRARPATHCAGHAGQRRGGDEACRRVQNDKLSSMMCYPALGVKFIL